MAYTFFRHDPNFGPCAGLEGPFHYPSGTVLYYYAKTGNLHQWIPGKNWFVRDRQVNVD